MTLNFESEYEKELPFDAREVAEKVFTFTMDYLGCPYEAVVSLLLTDDETIHQINKEQRDIDRATDVLSFPMTDYVTEGDFAFLEEEGADCFHPETGELLLGDIVISGDKVLQQAESYGHSPLREYAFLIVHSLLHLVGYDHMEEQEAKRMEKKQADVLESMGITR